MSLVPAFELGLWNAWILIIPLIIFWFSGIKFLFSKRMPENTVSFKRKKDKIIMQILMVTMFGSFFYSIFVPLKLGTIWLSIGLFIFIAGMVFIIMAMIDFATTPIDKPVTKGIYRYSRNPMFIGFFLVYLGIAVACVSWIYLVITILFILIMHYISPFEEAITLGHYGKAYKEYMKRTPKWIGIPKSEKK
jgi:protein-S-isoprenylcysteine O-methyltransferase Ste14